MKFLFVTASIILWSTAASAMPLRRSDLPQGSWMSLNNGQDEILLANDADNGHLTMDQKRQLAQVQQRFLWKESSKQTAGLEKEVLKGTSMEQTAFHFVDSSETYFSEYAQMWRMLGMYIDCDDLGEDNNQQDNDGACVRYLVWAAYADLGHQGYGMGEYALWDQHKNSWDRSGCGVTGGNRCVNMDCHLPETHMALIGYFKEPNFADWMEQLFKHEGICAWNYWNGCDTYESMQEMREAWPEECTEVDHNGETIYYDIAPQPEGRMAIGLYTDARCSQDYQGTATVAQVLKIATGDDDYQNYDQEQYYGEQQAYNGGGDAMIQQYCSENKEGGDDHELNDAYRVTRNIEIWNDAFDQWKYCQPCKAYDMSNTNANNNKDEDDQEKEDLENMGAFQCDDDAGYTNVNQCMKFKTKTTMVPLSFSQVLKASEQGTLTSFKAGNTVYGTVMGGTHWLARLGGLVVLVCGAVMFIFACRGRRDASMASETKEPFLEPAQQGVVA